MKETINDVLQQLCECYEDLGEDLLLLTALTAYGKDPELDDTVEACFQRLGDYIDQRAQEILRLASLLTGS